jgi:hypothetical protein
MRRFLLVHVPVLVPAHTAVLLRHNPPKHHPDAERP